MKITVVKFIAQGKQQEQGFLDKTYLQIHETLWKMDPNYETCHILEAEGATFQPIGLLNQFKN